METRKSIFREHLAAWLRADRKGRGEIVTHICAVAKVHPKSVPRSFRRVQMRDSSQPEKRGRNIVYGADVDAALKYVSEAANHPCGEILHALIPEYVRVFQRDASWSHSGEATRKLLAMSCATVKRKAEKFSHIRKMVRGRSTTKPGSVKSLIPLRSGPWADAPAGTAQIDTVVVPNEHFPKEPAAWLKRAANLWFSYPAADQCQFRRRLIGAPPKLIVMAL